ncbi:MAG: hypothetical protein ACRCTR_03275 [Actinomycetota bacterium]
MGTREELGAVVAASSGVVIALGIADGVLLAEGVLFTADAESISALVAFPHEAIVRVAAQDKTAKSRERGTVRPFNN